MRRIIFDWRLWFSIAFVGLVALATFYVMDAVEARNRSMNIAEATLTAQSAERRAAAQRAEELTNRIDELSGQLQEANEAVSRLGRQVSDLREQVVNLGGEPVVVTETERVVVEENSGRSQRHQSDDSFTTQSEPETDPCEKRNPQGKCVDPKGKR